MSHPGAASGYSRLPIKSVMFQTNSDTLEEMWQPVWLI